MLCSLVSLAKYGKVFLTKRDRSTNKPSRSLGFSKRKKKEKKKKRTERVELRTFAERRLENTSPIQRRGECYK
jgi:hypothetical protein